MCREVPNIGHVIMLLMLILLSSVTKTTRMSNHIGEVSTKHNTTITQKNTSLLLADNSKRNESRELERERVCVYIPETHISHLTLQTWLKCSVFDRIISAGEYNMWGYFSTGYFLVFTM